MMVIGIPACVRDVHSSGGAGQPQHAVLPRYGDALIAAGAVPLYIPPFGPAMAVVLDRLDGLLLSGSPSNVHPDHYGAPSATPDMHDPARDGTSIPLIHAAIARRMPILGVCRGIQELNVALGGSLHQQVHTVPGRTDHRGGTGDRPTRYRPQHAVALSGALAALFGASSIEVNSVHEQAIDRLAPGLVAEAVAPDGTIEGVRIERASFGIGVQWHPEWNAVQNPDSMALFAAFVAACRVYAATGSPP